MYTRRICCGFPYGTRTLTTYDLTGFKTFCTHIDFVSVSVFNDGDLLDVGAYRAICDTVRMAHVASCNGMLATDGTDF